MKKTAEKIHWKMKTLENLFLLKHKGKDFKLKKCLEDW